MNRIDERELYLEDSTRQLFIFRSSFREETRIRREIGMIKGRPERVDESST